MSDLVTLTLTPHEVRLVRTALEARQRQQLGRAREPYGAGGCHGVLIEGNRIEDTGVAGIHVMNRPDDAERAKSREEAFELSLLLERL